MPFRLGNNRIGRLIVGIDYDVNARAYINTVATAGGTLSDIQKTAINTLYEDLKANSLYTKIKYMYPFMGKTASSNAICGINPTAPSYTISWTNNLALPAAHTSAGVDCTAITNNGLGEITESPSTIHDSIDDITIGSYVSTAITNDQSFVVTAKVLDNSARYQLGIPFSSNSVNAGFGINNFTNYDNGAAPVGRWYASRTSSTLLTLYKGASSVATQTTSNAGAFLNTSNVAFFNLNTLAQAFDGVCGFTFGADGMDGTEIATLDGILSTYLTAIGR